jgi:hypothetical protein
VVQHRAHRSFLKLGERASECMLDCPTRLSLVVDLASRRLAISACSACLRSAMFAFDFIHRP